MATLHYSFSTTTSIDVYTSIDFPRSGLTFWWFYRQQGVSGWSLSGTSSSNPSSTNYFNTFSNLQPSTYYDVSCDIYENGSRIEALTLYGLRTNDPPVPAPNPVTNLSASAYDAYSGVATWTNGSYTSYCTVLLSNGNTYTTSNTSQNFYSLQPSTTYWVTVTPYNSNNVVGSSRSTSFTTHSLRPSYFSWTTSIEFNQPFSMTANEWTLFQNNINAVRAYKGFSNFAFTTVTSGSPFYASLYMDAKNAISPMSPPTPLPANRSTGEPIYASELNQLKNALNSIN